MRESIKRVIRTAQVYAPALLELKFAAMKAWRRARRVPHETDFEALRLFKISDDSKFLDVGANRGQSIASIKLYRPRGRIVAFEPNPRFALRLHSTYRDDSSVQIHECALGRETEKRTLFVPVYRNFVFDSLASLSEEGATEWLSSTALLNFDRRKLRVRPVPCQTRRLDDIDVAPGFIKIDTEGTELDVLHGGIQTIHKYLPICLIESAELNGPAHQFLAPLGYDIYAYHRGRLVQGQGGDLNSFLIPEARLGPLAPYVVKSAVPQRADAA